MTSSHFANRKLPALTAALCYYNQVTLRLESRRRTDVTTCYCVLSALGPHTDTNLTLA